MNAEDANGLGLWQISTVVPARALEATEQALGPVLGVPDHGVDQWVSGKSVV